MATLDQLRKDVLNALKTKVPNGDVYINHVPKKEKGLQYDLYLYLRDELGYEIVYELELPNLGQFVTQKIDESNRLKAFAHAEGSLVPDIVVKLDDGSFACFELKYNETNKQIFDHDRDKCKTYIEHCLDVHYAARINLLKGTIEEYEPISCKDPSYIFYYYYQHDKCVKEENALEKANDAYPIKDLWEEKLKEIKDGKGEFSEFDNTNYIRKMK